MSAPSPLADIDVDSIFVQEPTSSQRFTSVSTLDAWGVARQPLYEAAKRALDVTVSLLLLCPLGPLLLSIAVLIELEDGGPVLFR